jgi:LacI family transcriptional regulator
LQSEAKVVNRFTKRNQDVRKQNHPTLKDVARHANVSTATVSFVLNATKPVAPDTRARVEHALDVLGYRISLPAVALRTGRHRAIGLMVPDLVNPFFAGLAQAITENAWSHDYAVILAGAPEGTGYEAKGLGTLEERVDGIIWIPGGAVKLPSFARPFVILDRTSPDFGAYDSVCADHYAGGRATAILARELGRRCVGLLSGPATSPSARERLAGFIDHAQDLSIIWHHEVPYALDLPETIKRLLADPRIDIVIAANDIVAISVMRELRVHGRRVPEGVSVIGFDDIPWAALTDPPLTTLRQPLALLGSTAVQMLLDRIHGLCEPPRQTLLPVSTIRRGSTSPSLESSTWTISHDRTITHRHADERQIGETS